MKAFDEDFLEKTMQLQLNIEDEGVTEAPSYK